MKPLPDEILELIRRSEKFDNEISQELVNIRREYFESLVYSYVNDDDFDIAGHFELWRMCGKLWNDAGDISDSLRPHVITLMRVFDRVPETYAQVAQLLRWHIRLNKPRVRVATAFGVQ
jgi:hypothetical protein